MSPNPPAMIESFFKTNNQLSPQKGLVLIAEPLLHDFYFSQSIILLAEVNQEGVIGFVINHPLKIQLQSLFPDFPAFKGRISLGGPVSPDSLQYVYQAKNGLPGAVEIADNFYWGGDFDILQEWIITKQIESRQILFFLGYSGWAPGQLDREIEENTWLVSDHTTAEILACKKRSWNKSLEKMGNKYKAWANFPLIPEMN